MGRPSNREQRRREILAAFSRVLAEHGYAGATIAAVASEAGIAPGLIHHHFKHKEELLSSQLRVLMEGFRQRVEGYAGNADPLVAYADGALALDGTADVVAARCWVGLFAEGIRSPTLFKQFRAMIDREIAAIQKRSGYELSDGDASAILAFIIGSLVMGAFAPRKTAGFAAPALRQFIRGLRAEPG